MKRLILPLLIILALAGCAPQGKTGTITLVSPPDGAIIYSSALTVSGVAQGINAAGFVVTLTDAAGNVLARKESADRDADFNYELIHGYSGEPTAATVTVTAADAPDDAPYTVVNITLAALEHRPEGIYIDILAPQPGDEMGGDWIEVRGRMSGYETREFTLELIDSNAVVIDSVPVKVPAGYIADDLPWTVALDPGSATGSAILRIVMPDGTQPVSVPVVLSSAAG